MAPLKMFESETATILLVICLLAALVLSNYDSVDEFRVLEFKEPLPDKALYGHVIRTVQVPNEGSCRVQCYLEPNCVSINVGPLKDGKQQCELNNATDENQSVAVLKPRTGHTYLAIENLCSSSPCKNNGTCQAGFTRKGFRCICPVGVIGKNCSRDLRVACFKGANQFTKHHNFTEKMKWDDTNEVVKKCAKLAKAIDQKMFALGEGGVCFSGPKLREKYLDGGTVDAKCNHGIGIGNNMFVYSLEPPSSLQPVGCYRDQTDDRAMPIYATFRSQIIWTNMQLTVNQCARVAYDKGYEYFAIQFYGVCYGGGDAGTNYNKHGESENCWVFDNHTSNGVGRENANFVYRINRYSGK
ncbi:uncharacterized protein LOC144656967 isoform X2 [Oculina patagonica]